MKDIGEKNLKAINKIVKLNNILQSIKKNATLKSDTLMAATLRILLEDACMWVSTTLCYQYMHVVNCIYA